MAGKFEVSIVTRFGEGVASESLVVHELDEKMNVDAAGQVRTTFPPSMPAWIVSHLDAGLMVSRAEASDGTVQILGQVHRNRTQDLQFPEVGDTVALSYAPVGQVEITWEGRDGLVSAIGRTLTAGAAPAIGVAAFEIVATQVRLIPPRLTLAPNKQHRILVVLYVDKVT